MATGQVHYFFCVHNLLDLSFHFKINTLTMVANCGEWLLGVTPLCVCEDLQFCIVDFYFLAVQIGSPIVKSPHHSVGSASKTSKVIEPTIIVTRKDKEESDASETDCSINLIPELLEGSAPVPLDTESIEDKTKDSSQVKGVDSAVTTAQTKTIESVPVTSNDSTKKADTLPPANSNKKKKVPTSSGDIASSDLLSSDLTSSDSDYDVVPVTKKGRSKKKLPKVSTKKNSSKKQTQGQVIHMC